MKTYFVNCDRCGGCGYVETIGCCGNWSENGECKQYCCVPEQQQCSECGGCGQYEIEE